jgi:hypothetical protein
MIGVVVGIDQGSRLLHPLVVNPDDHPNSIPETQPLESLECQTPVVVDSNDHGTPNHTFNQAFDIVSPRTRACNLPGTTGKPNNKVICKKRCLFGESPSIAEAIKECSQTAKELKVLKKKMTKDIVTQILELYSLQ